MVAFFDNLFYDISVKGGDSLSDPKKVSPLLDEFTLGAPIGEHHGVECFPAIKENTDRKFRVKSYVICDRILEPSSLCSEDFDIITDVILFGVATFDSKGNVTVDRETLDKALGNLKEAIGDRDVEITLNFLGPGSKSNSSDWYEQMESLGREHNKAFASMRLENAYRS